MIGRKFFFQLRSRLVREFANLLRARLMATVFVTHDLAEASTICDRCAILDAGAIIQEGPIRELIVGPRTERIAASVCIECT